MKFEIEMYMYVFPWVILTFDSLFSSPEAALGEFAMRRFYDDKLGGVTQPSQRRWSYLTFSLRLLFLFVYSLSNF